MLYLIYLSQWYTAIPRFVRTSNSALSISAQQQILTIPRFVRILFHLVRTFFDKIGVIWVKWYRNTCKHGSNGSNRLNVSIFSLTKASEISAKH